MSRSCSVKLLFGDGEYTFRILFGEAVALQDVCDAGPRWIFGRLVEGSWHSKDISETIRQGLLGARELPAAKIKQLIDRYVENRPALENIQLARDILEAHLIGVPDEPIKKSVGRPGKSSENSPPSQEEKSGSEISTDGPASSESAQENSTGIPSGS